MSGAGAYAVLKASESFFLLFVSATESDFRDSLPGDDPAETNILSVHSSI
jgi:hypothetical protein